MTDPMRTQIDPIEWAWQQVATKCGFEKLPIADFLVLRSIFYAGFGSAWNLQKTLVRQSEEKRIAITKAVEDRLAHEAGKSIDPARKVII